MTFVDSHSHIYLAEFEGDQGLIMNRAENEGVRKILLPAIDSATHHDLIKLEKAYPDTCFAMMGLHPCSVGENYRDELKTAREQLEKRPFKAVGEIGLDFYWDKTYSKEQYVAFHEQLEWALHFDIPVSIHSRNATDECIKVVAEHQKGKLKGSFHCFSGNAEQAKKVTGLGFHLGIGGVLTFKNAGLDKVMETVPLEHIVLETDAPYLAPVPFRGKRNEPSYIKFVAEKLAGIKKMDIKEIAAVTTANSEKLFRL